MTQEVMQTEKIREQEENKEKVRRVYYEMLNQGDLTPVEEIFDSSVVDHHAPPGLAKGLDGVRQSVNIFRDAFPDLKTEIEFILADGDYVVARLIGSGTHTGEFKPIPIMPHGIPPSHEKFRITGTTIYRLINGRITDVWPEVDLMSLLTQIKAVPAPA